MSSAFAKKFQGFKKLLAKNVEEKRKEGSRLRKLQEREHSPISESLSLSDDFIDLCGWDGNTTIMIDPSMLSDHIDMIDEGELDE